MILGGFRRINERDSASGPQYSKRWETLFYDILFIPAHFK